MNIRRLLGETIIYGIVRFYPVSLPFYSIRLYINYIDKEAFAILSAYMPGLLLSILCSYFWFWNILFSLFRRKIKQAPPKNVLARRFGLLPCWQAVFWSWCLLFSNPAINPDGLWQSSWILRWFAWIAFLMRFVPFRLLYVITTSLWNIRCVRWCRFWYRLWWLLPVSLCAH